MRRSNEVALLALFSAVVVGSDYALAPYPNVKLLDVTVFVVAFVFGPRLGAGVAVVSETMWSVLSPWGQAGAISPFLVGGELLFVAAGWGASMAWGARPEGAGQRAAFMGALMLLCAFVWDFETNAATALLLTWPNITLGSLVGSEAVGLPFSIVHELADFVFGASVAPLAIPAILRMKARW